MERSEKRRERKYCSRLGLALVFVLAWSLVWQLGVAALDQLLPLPDTAYFVLALAGGYLVSLPAAARLVRCVPFEKPPRQAVSAGRLFRWFAAGVAILWGGSYLGLWANELAYALSGRAPVDLLTETFGRMPIAAVWLSACVFAPVCEELLFRYLLAGRLRRYGEGAAAFVSGLLFGLFHANLSQFFYAFGLGVLLAYAYFRTGRMAVPIALHMLFNLVGSGLPLLLPQTDAAALWYGFAMLALTVWGAVCLARGRKRLVWYAGSVPRDAGVLFGNAGMTLFVIACLVVLTVNFALL